MLTFGGLFKDGCLNGMGSVGDMVTTRVGVRHGVAMGDTVSGSKETQACMEDSGFTMNRSMLNRSSIPRPVFTMLHGIGASALVGGSVGVSMKRHSSAKG